MDNSFGGDSHSRLLFSHLQSIGYSCVIECGTGMGDTADWLHYKFPLVYTVDIKSDCYFKSTERLLKYFGVHTLYGDCTIHVSNILSVVEYKTIVYIDVEENYMSLQRILESLIRLSNKKELDICIVIRGIEVPDTLLSYHYSFENIKRFIGNIFRSYDVTYNTESDTKYGVCLICRR